MHLPPSRLPALFAALLLSIPGVARAGSYRPVDLGTLGGTTSRAHALSTNGLVAGESTLADGTTHAFLWRDRQLLDLGVLPDGTYSVALGVNAAGVVVGYGDVGDGTRRAFRWTDDGLVSLGLLPGGTYSVARGINDAGTIVGEADMDDAGRRRTRAVRFDVVPVDLGVILGSATSRAAAINSIGDIAGAARVSGSDRAFRRTATGQTRSIGAITDGSSDGYAIGVTGQVVGASSAGEHSQAFVSTDRRRPAGLPGLGGPNGAAFGINAIGDIVGAADDVNGAPRAVRWRNGQVLDLTTALPADSPWRLTDAAAINDAGQIAGTGAIDGRLHALLLIPEQSPEVTTTTTLPGASTTSTTIPSSVGCGSLGQRAAIRCYLDGIAAALDAAAPSDIVERRRARLVRLTTRAQGAMTFGNGSDLRGAERRRLRPRLAALLRALRRAVDAGDAQPDFADRVGAFTDAARGRLRA